MSQNNEVLLIDYLDKELNPEEILRVEDLIRNDRSVAAEWASLSLAVEAIELNAIRGQVASVRQSLQERPAVPVNQGAVLRKMHKTVMRVAAVLILVLGASVFYKYSVVTNASVYNQYFSAYDLNTTRGGAGRQDALDQAFRTGNWNEVLTVFNGETDKNNKSRFLAGMADLELKKFPEASEQFGQILSVNAKTGDSYFQDEAEYYLALTCLMNHQPEKAVQLIDQIRANPAHRYYPLAREISVATLKIIKLKSEK